MLKTRVITGVLLSVVISFVLIFSYIPWVLNTSIAFLSMQAIYELYRATGRMKNRGLYIGSCVFTCISAFLKLPGYEYITLFALLAAVAIFAYLFRNIRTINRVGTPLTIMVAALIISFFGCMSYIRDLDKGAYVLGGSIIVTVATDIAAYFVGRLCGKHKLAPIISPNKTIEGCVGGTLFSSITVILIACILQHFGVFTLDLGMLIIYTVTASVVGQFGDLALSSIKRIVGIKDYGKLLPGHGGILDRFDSMLFVMPFTYLFCSFLGTMI